MYYTQVLVTSGLGAFTHTSKKSKFTVFLGEVCTICQTFGGHVLLRGCSECWIYCEGLREDVAKNLGLDTN
jgi:hypothetical protein